jgi:cellobiose phosphorylase
MRYGYFDDDRREYVITRPDTPVPWINYLGTDAYFGTVSNTAGGFSWHRDARLRRLTRYRYNNVPGDAGGRYLYLRDDATGEYWSPSWQPTRTRLDEYECRHGLSYTAIRSAKSGIAAKTVYFVPRGENLEVWRVTVTNDRETAAELSLFSSVEFALWDASDDATNYQRNYSTGEVEVVDGVIYHKTEYRERRDHFAYFACSAPLAGFDTQREEFLGPTGDSTNRSASSAANSATPSRTGGPRTVRTTSGSPWSPARPGGHLRPRLLGEPARRQVRGAGGHQQVRRQAAHRALAATGDRAHRLH